MGRKVRMVPVDFNWPLGQVWKGFVNPHWKAHIHCVPCDGSGYSDPARRYKDEWYGNAPFDLASTGSSPWKPDHPRIVEDVRRKLNFGPDTLRFYQRMFSVRGEDAVIRLECARMCEIYNAAWSHHLGQADVDALIADNRLYDLTHTYKQGEGWTRRSDNYVPTPAEVNLWSLFGMGHDSINQSICVRARCGRNGEPVTCDRCKGDGYTWPSEAARLACETWEEEEPPQGPAYQIWETVSEGSPVSPPFLDPKDLARWMVANDTSVTKDTTFDEWVKFVTDVQWAPSIVSGPGGVVDGVKAAVAMSK